MGKYRNYQDYLDSDEWRGLRDLALALAGYRCESCYTWYSLDVHHLGYRGSWGNERVSDLEVLCRRCHIAQHDEWEAC